MIFSREKLFKLKQALLKLGSISTSDGTVLIYDSDTLEVGSEVFIDSDEGLTPAPDKDYIYDKKTVTVEGGKIVAIVELPIEQPVEEQVEEVVETEEQVKPEEQPTEEETIEEEIVEETVEGPTVDELQAIIDEQKAMIEELKAEIENLKAENEELKKKLEEPAAQPAEEEFKKENPIEEKKIDFSKYIKRNK